MSFSESLVPVLIACRMREVIPAPWSILFIKYESLTVVVSTINDICFTYFHGVSLTDCFQVGFKIRKVKVP